jgi:heme/copper-type cytochrome/quinol oxidase subunit 3
MVHEERLTQQAGAYDPSSGLTARQLGMLVALASFGMLFGTLVLSYLLARARAPVWPPLGVEPLPVLIPILSMPLMLGSSALVHEAWKRFLAGDRGGFRRFWGAATVAGLAFLALQTQIWTQLRQLGLRLDSNLYSGIIYVLTGTHALHVLAGIGVLVYVWSRSSRLAPGSDVPQLAAWFWHFLDAVWILLVALLVW